MIRPLNVQILYPRKSRYPPWLKTKSLSPLPTPSSGYTAIIEVGKLDNRGFCVSNDVMMKITMVSTKYWGDRGGGKALAGKLLKLRTSLVCPTNYQFSMG